jgi:photosystem II stability/assembly factor-like uncharacterized protein
VEGRVDARRYHTLTSLAFTDAKTGFATGHQGVLLRTEDGGSRWKQARST